MALVTKTRIESLDLLKGLVMVIMALDHVRDYFHYSAFFFDPADPAQSTLPIFFTRYITNFCAPAFSLLAGLSAFLVGKRKSPSELSVFLISRGLWLVFVEVIIVSFGWKFDIQFRNIGLATIWQLGVSMIVLAVLIHLPYRIILAFSCIIILGHDMLDDIHFEGNFIWALLHEPRQFQWMPGHMVRTAYPLVPWIGVMSLGYCCGKLYDGTFEAAKRKRILNLLGVGSLALFIALIIFNRYGNPSPWTYYSDAAKTTMSILNSNKYPPSLQYLLTTLGGTFLFLAHSEKLKGAAVKFFSVFGRVPFFFYIIHIYLIHLLAAFAAYFTGFGWKALVTEKFIIRVEALQGYGFNLLTVYFIWACIVIVLYPLCKRFDLYKRSHKEKWWLSYL
jgi:uncharacterized membrane protein